MSRNDVVGTTTSQKNNGGDEREELDVRVDCFGVALRSLEELLEDVHAAVLADSSLAAYVRGFEDTRSQRARGVAAGVIANIEYDDEMDSNEVVVCPGVIGASAETFDLICRVNDQKDLVRRAIADLAALDDTNVASTSRQRENAYKIAKDRLKRTRLNYHMATRHIVTLAPTPYRIGLTESRIKNIWRRSVADWLTDLQESGVGEGDPLVVSLRSLPANEPIAQVTYRDSEIRMNVCWKRDDALETLSDGDNLVKPRKDYVWKQKKSLIPVFIPLSPGQDLPKITDRTGEYRRRRNVDSDGVSLSVPRRTADARLRTQPLVGSTNLFRYRQS